MGLQFDLMHKFKEASREQKRTARHFCVGQIHLRSEATGSKSSEQINKIKNVHWTE